MPHRPNTSSDETGRSEIRNNGITGGGKSVHKMLLGFLDPRRRLCWKSDGHILLWLISLMMWLHRLQASSLDPQTAAQLAQNI
jgi:hypothetical protein